jgi:hypothetical protein
VNIEIQKWNRDSLSWNKRALDYLLAAPALTGSLVFAANEIAAPFGVPVENSSSHDLLLTSVAIIFELALFLFVPVYVRAKRREKIRRRIRIIYDSRKINPGYPGRPAARTMSSVLGDHHLGCQRLSGDPGR